jgi:alpha-galactosidase
VPTNASAGHEAADARTFAAWGVDYLKYDWCRNEAHHADQVRVFTAMRDALRGSGRHILYSINPNSSEDPTAGSRYDWSGIANMTRNTIDLLPLWGDPVAAANGTSPLDSEGVPALVAAAAPLAGRSRPGYWNDPDMLVIGISWAEFVRGHPGMLSGLAAPGSLTADQINQVELLTPLTQEVVSLIGNQRTSLTDGEQRAHLSLWAMLAAPLLAGNDVRTMSAQTRAILTNRDVIAVDQDPLVAQGQWLASNNAVMVKPLADGSAAVAIYNPNSQPVSIETSVAAIGLKKSSCYTVRDLWTHAESSTTDEIGRGAPIPAHGVTMLRVTPSCR